MSPISSPVLAAGIRLRSAVCDTEVIVIRTPQATHLSCGGYPMLQHKDETRIDGQVRAGFGGGSLLGKRYVLPGRTDLEVMVTRGGVGSLSVDGIVLVQKESKPLPSSD
jgi:hypothetical protein